MALQFSETAPGVHSATMTRKSSGQTHHVTTIESRNAWQLYIDGDLHASDLPSFQSAVARAEQHLGMQRSRTIVRAAAILVFLSIAGASAIGAAKVISADPSPLATESPGTNPVAEVANVESKKPQVAANRATSKSSQSDQPVVPTEYRSPYAAPPQAETKPITKPIGLAPLETTSVANSPSDTAPASIPATNRFSYVSNASNLPVKPIESPTATANLTDSASPPLPHKVREASEPSPVRFAAPADKRPVLNAPIDTTSSDIISADSTHQNVDKPPQLAKSRPNQSTRKPARLAAKKPVIKKKSVLKKKSKSAKRRTRTNKRTLRYTKTVSYDEHEKYEEPRRHKRNKTRTQRRHSRRVNLARLHDEESLWLARSRRRASESRRIRAARFERRQRRKRMVRRIRHRNQARGAGPANNYGRRMVCFGHTCRLY